MKYRALAETSEHKRHFYALKDSIATHLLEAGADFQFV